MKPIEIQPRRNVLRVVLVVVTVVPLILLWVLGPIPERVDGVISVGLVALHLISRLIPVVAGLYVGRVIIRILRDPRPYLAIDDGGVRGQGIRGVLPWSEISGAHVRTVQSSEGADTEALCFELHDPSRVLEWLDALPGLLGWFSRRQAVASGCIEVNLGSTGADARAMAGMVSSRARSVRAAVRTGSRAPAT